MTQNFLGLNFEEFCRKLQKLYPGKNWVFCELTNSFGGYFIQNKICIEVTVDSVRWTVWQNGSITGVQCAKDATGYGETAEAAKKNLEKELREIGFFGFFFKLF